MFAVLLTEPARPRNLFERLRWHVAAPPVRQERRESMGTAFLQLTVPLTSRGIPWQQVLALGGRYCRELVVQQGLALPLGGGFGLFEPKRYPGELAIATLGELLRRSAVPLCLRRVGVVDAQGQGAQCLAGLLRHCSEVTVYTRQDARYQAAAEEMLERYGAPVRITGRLEALRELPLLYAPAACELPGTFLSRAPLLAPYGAVWPGGRVCDGFALSPQAYPEGCPPAVDPNLFAAALYEKNGVPLPRGAAAGAICCNGRMVPPEAFSGYLSGCTQQARAKEAGIMNNV